MFPLSEDQYFFVIRELGLFPEVKPSTIGMIEQIMNAYILQSRSNVEVGINKILELEHLCQTCLNEPYVDVLMKLKPSLKESNIFVAQGEQVRGCYPGYGHKDRYYSDVGKQTVMNIEFALQKKLSYDGTNITWEDTFADWLDKVMMEREENTAHNPDDKLIYYDIFQQVQNLHWDIRHTILDEVNNYAREYRKKLLTNVQRVVH